MAVYADFTYYSGTFLGTAIASADFAALALRASAVIDQITFGRAEPIVTAATETTVITAIKNAMCAIAEEMQIIATDGAASGAIQSETIGQHSVTYVTGSVQSYTEIQRYRNAANVWLANTYLMFAGFNTGEYSGNANE